MRACLDLCVRVRYNKATGLMKNFSTLMLSLAAPKVSGVEEAKEHVTDESPIEMGRANLALSC